MKPDTRAELKKLEQEWIAEGRSEEQIHGVRNFLSSGKVERLLADRDQQVKAALFEKRQTFIANVEAGNKSYEVKTDAVPVVDVEATFKEWEGV